MDQWAPLGLHRYKLEGGVLWFETAGEFTQADLDLYVALYESLLKTEPALGILADVTRGIAISPQVRKRAAEALRPQTRPVPIAVVGASLAIRTLFTLFTNAHQLTSGVRAVTTCFSDLSMARAWLAQQLPRGQ